MPAPAVLDRGRGLVFPASYAAAVRSLPGLVYYWRLREGAPPAKARDETNTADATYTGTPRQVVGPPGILDGGAVRVTTGAGGYVTGPTTAISQTSFTLLCWTFLASAQPNAGIFGQWTSPGGGAFLWWDAGSPFGLSMVYTTTAGNYLRPNIALLMNRWHLVAGTWDGATQRLYVDGLQIASAAMATAPGTPTTAWYVGTYNGSAQIMTGSVCEAAYWNRALAPSEIAYLNTLGR